MKTTLIYLQKQQTHGTAKRTHRQPQRATKGNTKQGDIDNKKLDCWPYKRQPGADTKRPESPWSQRQAFIHWKAVALHIAQGWASRWGRGGGIHQGRCSDKADVSKLERGRGNKGGATLDWKARLTGGLGDYHISTPENSTNSTPIKGRLEFLDFSDPRQKGGGRLSRWAAKLIAQRQKKIDEQRGRPEKPYICHA